MDAPALNGILVPESEESSRLPMRGASAMPIPTVGLDVAKQVFQIHGGDAHGQVVVRKQLRRKEGVEYFTKLPAWEIGMEACSSSH